jgi:hypothetical protein
MLLLLCFKGLMTFTKKYHQNKKPPLARTQHFKRNSSTCNFINDIYWRQFLYGAVYIRLDMHVTTVAIGRVPHFNCISFESDGSNAKHGVLKLD